jgi:hypothetical protein
MPLTAIEVAAGLERHLKDGCVALLKARAEKAEGERDAAVRLLKNVAFMARTSGGTAGPDAALMAACSAAEDFLSEQNSAH